MAYKLTPEQYKDAAQRRIDNPNTAENTNSAVSEYARAINANRALDNKNAKNAQSVESEIITTETDDDQADGNWFVRTLSTIAAPVLRFSEGVAKFVENSILDAGAGLTASVLDIFGADDAAKDVQSWAAQDLVGEAFDWEPIQDIYNNSWSNEWGRFGEILQEGIYAVGNQAIPFALNFIPGVGTGLSIASYAMSGYGGGFEAASQDGGSVLGASAYGLISAGLETAIESIGGSMNFGGATKQGLSKVISKVSKGQTVQALLGMVVDAAEEGAEEVISGMLDNYVKAMTYQSDTSSVQAYFNNILNAEPATQEALLEQFLVGAMAGGLMAGTTKVVTRTNSSLRTNEMIQEMDELREKGYNLNQRGKDTTATEAEYSAKEKELVTYVNSHLDKFNARKANGNKSATQILDYMDKNFNRDESGAFSTSKNGLVKADNVSYGTTEADIERAVTSQGNTVHNGALEGVSAQAKSNVEKAIRNINKGLGGSRLNLVVADIAVKEDGTRDYGYLAGNTVVVDASMLGTDVEFTVVENGKPVKYKAEAGISTLLHEVFHFTENTKAGMELRKLLSTYGMLSSAEARLRQKESTDVNEKAQYEAADIVSQVESAYKDASGNVLTSELSARQLENLLFNEKIINRLTEDNTTLAKRILHKAERILQALKGGNLHETKGVEALLKKTIKLYNKAIVQVGKGKTYQVVSRKGLDNDEQKDYDNTTQQSRRVEDDGREENREDGRRERLEIGGRRDNSGWRSVSYTDDKGRIHQLYELVRNGEKYEEINRVAQEIYAKPKTETQDELQWHAKNEEINLFFVKRQSSTNDFYVLDGNNLFIDENATEKQFVDILNVEKPIQRKVDNNKIAKISQKRWDNLLSWKPDAYVTRISIQQFLDMTTQDYVEQRSINALAEQYAKKSSVANIQNNYQEAIYLEIDFETGKVVNHEGRHRMTALFNAGNAYADVFVLPSNKTDFESKARVEIEGQFDGRKYPLGLVRANSERFARAIENTFRREDENIRYSRRGVKKDSKGRELSEGQLKHFGDFKAVDKDGNLQVLYHGTKDEFYVFDRLMRGKTTGARDAKLGFFFTSSLSVADSYAVGAQEQEYFNLWNEIATTEDEQTLELVRADKFYDHLDESSLSDTVRAFVKISKQIDEQETKVMEVYLDMKNPLEEDWAGKEYKKGAMLRVVTKAKQNGYDGVIIRNIDDSYEGHDVADTFVVFEPNQIKLTSNKNPTKDNDIRYSRRLTDYKYTPRDEWQISREEYNHHAWAVVNGVVSAKESAVFLKKIGEKKFGTRFTRNPDKLYMIPVGEDGIENKIIYTDGEYEAPSIEKVVVIKLTDETSIDIVRGFIYESKGIIDANYFDGLLEIYDAESFQYGTQRNRSGENSKDNSRELNRSRVDSEIRRSRRIISREDVSNAVEDTLNMLTAVGNIDENAFDVSLESKNKLLSVYVTQLKEQAVNGRLTEKSKTVKNLVDAIFDNAVLTEHYAEDLGESAMLLTSLRPYLHSINLSSDSIKADIQQRYGKQNNMFRLWGKKNGGRAWDTVVHEIVETMPQYAVEADEQGNADIATLFNIFDSYTKAVADMKQKRVGVASLIRNVNEVKRYMAKQLVLSLNESGTELVTKLTADKLQSIITEERNALQETLRAVKNGESEITFQGQNLSAKAKQSLVELVGAIAKERANVYAEKKADAVIAHIKKGVTAEEMRDIRKTEAYKKISEYIAEQRLKIGKEVSIKSIEESNPTAAFSLKQAIATVKNVRTLEKRNANALKQIRDMDTALLKQRAKELALDDAPIRLLGGLKESVKALFKTSVDGKRLMTSYEEMLSSGTLKGFVSAFRAYCADGNPIVQDMVDSGMMEGVRERLEAYEKYIETLDAETYANMSLIEKQTFHNAFAMFLAEVVRATKPTTNITVDGKTVSMKKYRDKSLRGIMSSLTRGKDGQLRAEKRALGRFFAKYLQSSVRPYEAIALAENHAGALEKLYNEVREGSIKGENARADLEDLIFAFLDDKNNKVAGKKYDRMLLSEEVTIEHSEGSFVLSKGELLGLYLTLIQEDGFLHADASNPMAEGVYFDNKQKGTDYRNKTALKFTAENVVAMEKLLSETDLRFIEKVREFFAEAGKLKAETDTLLYGMERLLGEDYYPLQTDESARASKLGDKVSFYDALDPSGHLSINQSRTFGVNALRVRNILDVLTSYAKSVGLYYGVAIPVANMRLVYNSKGVYGDSIKSTIAKYTSNSFDKYLDKLLLDVQGAIKVSDSFMERQRQRYASFAVAANIKSPIKALGGLFSLSGRLKTTAFLKGLTTSPLALIKSGKADFSQMYEYCPATRIRYRDKQATLAAMNVEGGARAKNKVVDALAIGIELVDKYTVYVAWNSAKAEVGAVGANANDPELLKKAGKLLNETLDTIDRFEMTERNAFSRSEDSFRRGLAMFTSSAQAQLTQFIDKTFRLMQLYNQKKHLPTVIKEAESEKTKYAGIVAEEERAVEKAKQSGDDDALRKAEHRLRKAKEMLNDKTILISELYQKQATIDQDIKKAKLFTKKAIVSISMAIVVSAALSQLMSNLMGDEDEEEKGMDFVYGMLDESLSNVFGMLPLIGQFYNALEFNIGDFEKKSYDMSFWVIDEWNALADALNGFVALVDGSGTKTPARVARDFAYALGQWFGIPTRNLFNAMNTVLKAIPSARYTVNDWFSKGNYGSDLKNAVDSKDTELADTIVRLMMKDTFGDTDTKVVKTVRSLYEQGYAGVIPKTVSSSIVINGESYTMTQKQQVAFKRTYSQADTAIEKLIGKQLFTTLSAKVQADSIKWIYEYYYQKAKEELTGIEDDSRKALFGSYINVETLAVAYSYCKSLEADTDKKGNAIAGTRKAKVVKYLNALRLTAAEKYMILGYLGYSPVNNNAERLITAFARKNGASKAEIKELLDMCNIAA